MTEAVASNAVGSLNPDSGDGTSVPSRPSKRRTTDNSPPYSEKSAGQCYFGQSDLGSADFINPSKLNSDWTAVCLKRERKSSVLLVKSKAYAQHKIHPIYPEMPQPTRTRDKDPESLIHDLGNFDIVGVRDTREGRKEARTEASSILGSDRDAAGYFWTQGELVFKTIQSGSTKKARFSWMAKDKSTKGQQGTEGTSSALATASDFEPCRSILDGEGCRNLNGGSVVSYGGPIQLKTKLKSGSSNMPCPSFDNIDTADIYTHHHIASTPEHSYREIIIIPIDANHPKSDDCVHHLSNTAVRRSSSTYHILTHTAENGQDEELRVKLKKGSKLGSEAVSEWMSKEDAETFKRSSCSVKFNINGEHSFSDPEQATIES